MLTIRQPITLKCDRPITGIKKDLNEKIFASYSLMSAKMRREEMLFVAASAPEVYFAENGQTNIFNEINAGNETNVKLEVINNLINRIMLSQTEGFTYRDEVYITNVLNKLGITDVSLFMKQITEKLNERKSSEKLLKLYRENKEYFDRVYQEDNKKITQKSEENEAENRVSERLYIHNMILKRLNTEKIYNDIRSLTVNRSQTGDNVTGAEFSVSEQTAFANDIEVWNVKNMVLNNESSLEQSRVNIYELPGDERTEKMTDEERLSAAVLTNLIEQTFVLRAEQYANDPHSWFNVTKAMFDSARNTYQRYESNLQRSEYLRESVSNTENRLETTQKGPVYGEYNETYLQTSDTEIYGKQESNEYNSSFAPITDEFVYNVSEENTNEIIDAREGLKIKETEKSREIYTEKKPEATDGKAADSGKTYIINENETVLKNDRFTENDQNTLRVENIRNVSVNVNNEEIINEAENTFEKTEYYDIGNIPKGKEELQEVRPLDNTGKEVINKLFESSEVYREETTVKEATFREAEHTVAFTEIPETANEENEDTLRSGVLPEGERVILKELREKTEAVERLAGTKEKEYETVTERLRSEVDHTGSVVSKSETQLINNPVGPQSELKEAEEALNIKQEQRENEAGIIQKFESLYAPQNVQITENSVNEFKEEVLEHRTEVNVNPYTSESYPESVTLQNLINNGEEKPQAPVNIKTSAQEKAEKAEKERIHTVGETSLLYNILNNTLKDDRRSFSSETFRSDIQNNNTNSVYENVLPKNEVTAAASKEAELVYKADEEEQPDYNTEEASKTGELIRELRILDQKNLVTEERLNELTRERSVLKDVRVNKKKVMSEALKALTQPGEVLQRVFDTSQQEPVEKHKSREDIMYELMSDETKAIFEQVERQSGTGSVKAGEELQKELVYAKNEEASEELPYIAESISEERVELPEKLTKRLVTEPVLNEHIVNTVNEQINQNSTLERVINENVRRVELVHKSEEQLDIEELKENLLQKRNEQVTTESVINEKQAEEKVISHTETTRINNISSVSIENVDEMIKRSFTRQLGQISDQVYRKLEKKLESERKRRGR